MAKATDIVGTSINNGEGGLLPEERDNSYKQVVQILPSRMGFTLRNIEAADALEILADAREEEENFEETISLLRKVGRLYYTAGDE